MSRTVLVATHPLHTQEDAEDIAHNIGVAARVALGGLPEENADVLNAKPVEAQKFDLKVED